MAHPNVTAQLEHNRCEEQLADKAHRIIAGILWLLVCIGMGVWFATFGWLAASHSLNEPNWLILSYIFLAVMSFVMCMVALFKGLDDLFYKRDDRRRLTRRKSDI